MKKRLGITAAAVAVVAVVMGGVTLASAGSDPAQSARRWGASANASRHVAAPAAAPAPAPTRIINLVERFSDQEAFIDVGEADFSPGDYIVWRDPLFNQANTTRVGTVVAQCTFSFSSVANCEATLTLRDRGKITVAGTSTESGDAIDIAITGGQGEFRAVRGEMRVTFGQGDSDLLTLRIVD